MCQLCGIASAEHQVSRRRLIQGFGAATAAAAMTGRAIADPIKAPPKPQNAVSSEQALKLLMEGNARYVDGVSKRHDFKHEREALTLGQNPYAAILSCADSRITPEYAFDSGRGDLFVCRVAGNFASDDIIASLEYAVSVLNTPLIMVLGHEACGAVSATIKSLKGNETLPGHLPALVAAIAPAVKASEGMPGDPLANAIRQNVILKVRSLKTATPILNSFVDQAKLRIAGAIYRLADGHVDLLV